MALKKNLFDPHDIQIRAINILKSEINQEGILQNPGPIAGFQVEFSHDIAYNFDEKAARIRLFFNIYGKNENDERIGVYAQIDLEYHFQLENGQKYFKKEKDNFVVNQDMVANLFSVAYATARGIIWQLTLPTVLQGVILPVVDATEFLTDQVK